VDFPELYSELYKLPDLQIINQAKKKAIDDIAQLAGNPAYREAFKSVLNTGIKEARNYCSPLQALLWLAYDENIQKHNPLEYYSLEFLISRGWQDSLTSNNYKSERWGNFEEVASRLNSPELVRLYMIQNLAFSYVPYEEEGIKSAEEIFASKKGACYDLSLFAAYCLKKNGYGDVNGMLVRFQQPLKSWSNSGAFDYWGHVLCVYKDPKDSLYYTVDSFSGINSFGPFQSVEEAARYSCRKQGLKSYGLYSIDMKSGKYATRWSYY